MYLKLRSLVAGVILKNHKITQQLSAKETTIFEQKICIFLKIHLSYTRSMVLKTIRKKFEFTASTKLIKKQIKNVSFIARSHKSWG